MIVNYEKMRYDRLLEGGHALITGGNGEIGRAIARLFASQGATLAITDVNGEGVDELMAQVHQDSPDSFFLQADIADAAAADAMLDAVLSRLGYVDILVNNAGIFIPGLLHEASLEDLERMMAVNLSAAVHCTQRVVPGMMERRGGTIVSIASDYATHAVPGISLFAASKAALLAFTRGVGMDYALYDVRANCVMPGYTVASMGKYLEETLPPDRLEAHMTYGQPLNRPGSAEDVANAALYLASPMCRFVTGEAIPVNGGVQAVAHKQMLGRKWDPENRT